MAIKKIIFFLTVGFIVQYLFSIPTWFDWKGLIDWESNNPNWVITDLSRVCRIFIFSVVIIKSFRVIYYEAWGFWIFAIDIGSNIITVLWDYGFIDKLDYSLFWTRKLILLIAIIITVYQVNTTNNSFTKEE